MGKSHNSRKGSKSKADKDKNVKKTKETYHGRERSERRKALATTNPIVWGQENFKIPSIHPEDRG